MALRTLAIDAGASEVVSALQQAGIEPILLRGPAFATLLYDPPEVREYVDVDLLVSTEDLSAAELALRALGLRPRFQWGEHDEIEDHGRGWAAADPRFSIDLHHSVAGARAPSAIVYRSLAEGARRLVLGVTRPLAPNAAGVALLAALHVAQHGSSGKVGEDLRRAVDRLSPDSWRAAGDLAEQVGALGPFALGLGQLPEGKSLLEGLDLAEEQVSTSQRVLATGAPRVAYAAARAVELRGRERIAYLWSKLLPAPGAIRRESRLAHRGWLGLALAYLGRIAGRILAVPKAIRIYVRARRGDT